MQVLVLGAGGMAGHVIATHLSEKGYDVSTVSARNKLNESTTLIDVTDQDALEHYLSINSFDAIINCIGVLVQQSEDRQDLATYLNAYLPHYLEHRYRNTPTRIIHLSTDCVFSGKNAPYNESSIYDGEIFYDRSKALGELKNDKDLTFRMSIIGPDMQEKGIGLFNWFMSQKGEIQGYETAIWSGVTTITLARAIQEALQQNLTGLYHLVPDTSISKYNLLLLFKDQFTRQNLTITPTSSVSLDKTLINTRDDFNFTVPDYQNMIIEMRDWINSHKDLYEHYKEK